MAEKRRIAVLGGGVGALSAVFEITNASDWREHYEITVYQMGWRLGGKGASGRDRDLADRIEEHGLHVWLGFYENGFHMLRGAYQECADRKLTPDSPFQSWEDAFRRQDYGTNMEHTEDGWVPWTIHFPTNDQLPGDPKLFDGSQPGPTPWDLFLIMVEWVARQFGTFHEKTGGKLLEMLRESPIGKLVGAVERSAIDVLAALVRTLDPDPSTHSEHTRGLIGGLLHHLATEVMDGLEALAGDDKTLRLLFLLLDCGLAALRGMLVDGVLTEGFQAIDHLDLVEWLEKNGCRHPRNPFVIAGYDALFAYENGDPAKPNISAGVGLYGLIRMMLTYRGSMFWRMRAGMGDTIFSPLYLVLKERGVRFEFFQRAQNLGLSADQSAVETIDFDVQATLKDPAGYQPLYPVKGLPCWPDEPFYEQLVQGEEIRAGGFNLESDYTPWHGRIGSRTLRRGVDFDDVLLGIPPGALRFLCTELAAARPEWAAMLGKVATTQTQAMQLWCRETSADLGYPPPSATERPAVTAYVEPFDTWADMSHLIPMETWRAEDGVRSIAYFCNAFQDAAVIPPPFSDPAFPGEQLARVRQMALEFLNNGDIQVLWPNCGKPFRWELLVQRDGKTGGAVLDTQFLRANIDGTERYVLSVKGSTGARLHPGRSGFANLFLAGDWTYNVLNCGCVEAAVISGRLASQAICGRPRFIYGAFGAKEGVKAAAL